MHLHVVPISLRSRRECTYWVFFVKCEAETEMLKFHASPTARPVFYVFKHVKLLHVVHCALRWSSEDRSFPSSYGIC